MNKEILEIKIAELLDIPSEEKKVAFSLFKEKLSSFLKVGEALRIKDIGVFQLKEKFSHSSSKDISTSGVKNLTILFSSDTDKSPSDSLFLNLDIDKNRGDENEFNEDVFQLGIGKSLITNIEDGNLDDMEEKSSISKLEEKIGSLFSSSEKIESFDLWEDHFKIKETKNMLDDELDIQLEEDLNEEDLLEEGTEIPEGLPVTNDEPEDSIDKDYLEEEFVELNDEEKLDSYLDENDFELDDVSETMAKESDEIADTFEEVTEDKAEKTFGENDNLIEEAEEMIEEKTNFLEDVDDLVEEKEDLLEDFEETVEEKVNLVDDTEEVFEDEFDKPIKTIEDMDEFIDELEIEDTEIVKEKSVIDEIEMELKNDEEIDKPEEELLESQLEESSTFIENDLIDDSNILEANLAEDTAEKEEYKPVVKASKTKNRTVIFALIGAFIIIGALAIYYLFFNNSVQQFGNGTREAAISENIDSDQIESEDSDLLNEEKVDEPIGEKIPSQSNINEKSQQKKVSAIEADAAFKTEVEDEPETGDAEISDSENYKEKEISNNIYHDGYVYNVQVSSWKNREIAENEVNKLVKKGFPAFIVKAYIQKFQGTWYRVRVGPYTSLDEAKIAQSKI